MAGQHARQLLGSHTAQHACSGKRAGLVKLQVKNGAGEQTVNLFVEPVVPAVFPSALNAVNGALITQQSPIHPGEYVALFLTAWERRPFGTDLNWAKVQPEVTVGGQPCAVTFAGRSPGYEGLDQINCQIPLTLQPSDNTQVLCVPRHVQPT